MQNDKQKRKERNAIHRIPKVPNSNPNTSLNLHTRAHRHLIISTLLRQIGRIRRQKQPDIQLSNSNINAQLRESLHILNLTIKTRRLASNEMTLQAHPINPQSGILQHLHDALRSRSFGTRVFNIIIIVIQLRPRVSLSCRRERDLDVIFAEHAVEGVVAESAVIVQGFVYDVPGVALRSPMACFGCYVLDQGGR